MNNLKILQGKNKKDTCCQTFILNDKDLNLNYWIVDIKKHSSHTLEPFIKKCEFIEKKCWNAKENFKNYFLDKDILFYAENSEKIVGFVLISLDILDKSPVLHYEEGMILKEYQKQGILKKLILLAARITHLKLLKKKIHNKIAILGVTNSPKIMTGLFKKKILWNLVNNSFVPSKRILEIHKRYIAKYKYSILNPKYPFILKKIFPGCQGKNICDKFFKFPDNFKKYLPSEFDYFDRGDAFCFIIMPHRLLFNIGTIFLSVITFNKDFLFNPNIGIIKQNI